VEQPRHLRLRPADRDYAAQALRVASQLGGDTATLAGHDAVGELLRFARDHNFSKIVVGKPGRFWWFRDVLTGTFLGRLAAESGDIDVFIVHGGREKAAAEPVTAPRPVPIDWRPYAGSAAVVAAATCLAGALFALEAAPANLIMVYLVGVVLVAARWGRSPSILAAILSVAAFDFLFVPPFLTFAVSDTQYALTFAVMLMVGILISTLTVRIKEQA